MDTPPPQEKLNCSLVQCPHEESRLIIHGTVDPKDPCLFTTCEGHATEIFFLISEARRSRARLRCIACKEALPPDIISILNIKRRTGNGITF